MASVEMDDLATFIRKSQNTPFRVSPYYERKTDSLILYLRDVKSYGERLNNKLTLFLSRADDSLVGIEVKGVARLLKIGGSFGLFVVDHKIKLGAFLGVAMSEEPEDPELERRYGSDLQGMKDHEIDPEELLAQC